MWFDWINQARYRVSDDLARLGEWVRSKDWSALLTGRARQVVTAAALVVSFFVGVNVGIGHEKAKPVPVAEDRTAPPPRVARSDQVCTCKPRRRQRDDRRVYRSDRITPSAKDGY